jgi:hypothetical protein
MKNFYTFLLLLLIGNFGFGQIIYDADFSTSGGFDHNNGNPPATGPQTFNGGNYIIGYDSTPSTDGSGNYFRSDGTLLESADFGGAAYFETNSIDISGQSSFSIAAIASTFGSSVFNGANEQFTWSYIIDSGTPVSGPNITSDGSLNSPASWTDIPVTGNFLVVRFDFNINGGGDGFEVTQVEVTGVPSISNDTDTEVLEPTSQVAAATVIAANVTTNGTAFDAFGFDIEDQGTADGLPTNVTSMRFVPGPNNTADWTDAIQGVTLLDGNVVSYTPTTSISDTEIILTFGSAIAIPDNTTLEFLLGLYLNTSNIVDGNVIQLQIDATSSGFAADASGSSFSDPFTHGDVVGNNIIIDIDATLLSFTEQPTDVFIDTITSPSVTVAYTDINGNVDIDYTGFGFDISLTTDGNFDVSATTIVEAVNGIATFSNLIFDTLGSGIKLTATDDSTFIVGTYDSDLFNVIIVPSIPSLIITEVADPGDNAAQGRFVELYNNGVNPIDLAAENIYFVRQANGSGIGSAALIGTIDPGCVYVISGSTNFSSAYGYTSDFFSGFLSGNGDDGYFIYYGGDETTGTLLDAYGELGQDGTGELWEYENSRATRNNPKTTSPNATWTASEWTISSADVIDMTPGALENEYRYAGVWKPSDPNGVSTISEDMVIVSGNAIINTNTSTNSVFVKPEASITIDPSITLTIDAVEGMTLNSTSDSYSSLILDGAILGTIKYQRFVNANSVGNDLISPPLSGETWTDFLSSDTNATDLLDDGNTSPTTYAFSPFDKTVDDFVNYTDATSATLDSGIGYRAGTNAGTTLTFTGSVPTTPISVNITDTGAIYPDWNLIGNPYPSYISIADFLNYETAPGIKNIDILEDISGIYGYDGSASNGWDVITLANAGARLMTPGQGFFVAADDADVASYDITFDTSMRATGSDDDFILGRNTNILTFLDLEISTSNERYKTEFYFNDNASLGIDAGYDATLLGRTAPSFALYSHLVQDNTGLPMALQVLNTSDLADVIIPLGVNANQGEQLSFSLREITLPTTVDVFLDDNVANTSTLLNTSDYILTPTVSLNGTGRFYLRVTNGSLSTPENTLNNLSIFTNKDAQTIVIDGQLLENTMVKIYDIQGRIVSKTILSISNQHQNINVSHLSTGIYVLKLENTSQNRTEKVIIN